MGLTSQYKCRLQVNVPKHHLWNTVDFISQTLPIQTVERSSAALLWQVWLPIVKLDLLSKRLSEKWGSEILASTGLMDRELFGSLPCFRQSPSSTWNIWRSQSRKELFPARCGRLSMEMSCNFINSNGIGMVSCTGTIERIEVEAVWSSQESLNLYLSRAQGRGSSRGACHWTQRWVPYWHAVVSQESPDFQEQMVLQHVAALPTLMVPRIGSEGRT